MMTAPAEFGPHAALLASRVRCAWGASRSWTLVAARERIAAHPRPGNHRAEQLAGITDPQCSREPSGKGFR